MLEYLPALIIPEMRAGIIDVDADSPDQGLGARFLGLPKGRVVLALDFDSALGASGSFIQSGRAGGSGLWTAAGLTFFNQLLRWVSS